ncbi:MAG TPA: VacJ family lipoprotein [Porticoccaceae bacterium]|nr:VacJ family lipoprotein [Porticoccaceae bacterium]
MPTHSSRCRHCLRLAGWVTMFAVSSVLASNAMAQTLDPWRVSNERIFNFNDFIDEIVVKPVARTYGLFVPRFGRQFIGNFFSNIDDINVFVNDLLQLKFDAAVSDCGRFLINSSIGLFGFFDVATGFGLRKNEEDFGQTLAHWGAGTGPYVVLPMFGASNVRDSFGLVLDTLFNPVQYQNEESLRITFWLLEELDARARVLALDELIVGDEYLFIREAYIQRRGFLISDGRNVEIFGGF